MSTQVPPLSGDAPRQALGSALPTEEALHASFLVEYPTIADEARLKLGPDAVGLTPKVVEGAFVRAWDARDRLHTTAELHAFLVDDVHHAAARALSRRLAAHRFAGSDAKNTSDHKLPTTTPEESWQHVLHAIQGGAHSANALSEQAKVSRHEAAEHITSMTKGSSLWKPILFGAVVIAALVGVAFWFNHLGADAKIATAVNASDARVIASLPSQLGNVTLDDGTKVRLAPETKLSIPKAFGPDLRAVKLEGVAHFEVAPGQPKEFQVHSRDAVVVAKGTAFTVSSYPGESMSIIVVTEGSVEVRQGKERPPQTLAAGGGLVIKQGAEARAASPAEVEQADGWRSGMLVVNDGKLRDVLPQLSRWYGVNIIVPEPENLERRVTLKASLDSVMQAIQGIEQSSGLRFGYIGQNKVLRMPDVDKKAATAAKKK
jgi:ferric-dicitrate binding protein FerR (iron transport regulator)